MDSDRQYASPTRAYEAAVTGARTVEQRPTPAAAFQAARSGFRQGVRLDMAALAAEIGVSRGTLYRWTGDRDRLLADVIWLELSDMIDHFDRSARGSGVARMTYTAGAFLDALASSTALRAFLVNEGDGGLRMVTAVRGGVRPRILGKIVAIIEREAESGYALPAEPQILADGLVSLAERWLYHGGEPTLNPDPETARQVIALLLRE